MLGDPPLLAPDARLLEARVARRSAGRLRRARSRLGSTLPGAASTLAALDVTLAALPPDARRRLLYGPDVRGFLGEAEVWIDVLRLAAAARRSGSRWGVRVRQRPRSLERLFDRIARTEHLATLLPRGRLDARLPRRAARLARRRLRQALRDLASFILGVRLAYPVAGRFEERLAFREDAEQGRPADRIDLGTIAGPAGPLSIVAASGPRPRGGADRAREPRSRGRAPRWVRARLRAGTLSLGSTGEAGVVLPAAGSRWRAADFPPPGSARRAARGGLPPAAGAPRSFARSRRAAAPRLARRDMVPGTSILLAPRVDSAPRRLTVGRPVPGLGRRLADALRIVRLAWPAGHREIIAQTSMVVPVRERGLVSYSLASRPGISFINVFGKTTLDLADDLLHETAHHRLHALQEIDRFLAPGPATEEVQAFDSPWRATRRPLHGLLHGGYTFLFRAELFRRVLRAASARPRLFAPLLRPRGASWIRREMRREIAMLSRALGDLDEAARAGLLTRPGRRLARAMRLWAARLGTGASRS